MKIESGFMFTHMAARFLLGGMPIFSKVEWLPFYLFCTMRIKNLPFLDKFMAIVQQGIPSFRPTAKFYFFDWGCLMVGKNLE